MTESSKLANTKDLMGAKVWIEKPKKKDPDATKRMGKVRACVFHPRDKRFVGFTVKRPDVALMFHRRDLFVAYNGYDVVDGSIVVRDDPAATDKGACKALGVDWDACVLWIGLPVMCEDGTSFGLVGSVVYDAETGKVDTLEVTQGATANTLLGQRRIPAALIRGFRRGMGAELATPDDPEGERTLGAILVDDAVKELAVEGGLAEKAGAATAKVGDAAHNAIEAAKPKVSEAAAVAGEAVNKGAYATGRQIKRASGMFAGFKEEYDKAAGKTSAPVPEEAVEYVYLDEDGNEIVFVDEDGNPITDPALLGDELGAFDVVEDDASSVQTAGARSATRTSGGSSAQGGKGEAGVTQAVGSHLKKAGGMLSAFKEEYDRARHE